MFGVTCIVFFLKLGISIFRDLLFDHSELTSLKSLLAVLSVPRTVNRANPEASTSTAGSSPDKIVPTPSLMMAPTSTPWTPSQIEPFLQRIGPSQPVNGMPKNYLLRNIFASLGSTFFVCNNFSQGV